MIIAPLAALAQSGTNSPYSQYGLGVLSDQSTGFNRGMNGVSYGMHEKNQVNFLNPASYANMDSLTFIFDVGASAQVTNFMEGTRKLNASNADIEYAVMGFQAAKHLGMSIGILPYSNVGYNYYATDNISTDNSTTYTTTYSGSGGTRLLYIGAGYMPVKGLSIGANVGYFWGSYSRSAVNSYSDGYINTVGRYYSAELTSYYLNAGLQYTLKLGRQDNVTLGLAYTMGHNLSGDANINEITSNTQTSVTDTTKYAQPDAIFIPTTFGGGLAWYHGTQWRIGADYTLQQWSKKAFPDFRNGGYYMVNDALKDRHKFNLGGEYIHNAASRKYLDRVHFRAGVSYATPYIRVNGMDGPKEMSASIGFGLPITNAWNNRSMLNISGQWTRVSATGLIRENTFRINVGITFNERWFMKWKLE